MKKLLNSIGNWLEERTGVGDLIKHQALHPVPPGSKWWYVFGSATLVAFIIQVVTGIALATMYVPSAGEAFHSLQYITNQAPFGRLLRGMHYFGASAMVLLAILHMVRTYIMASYKYPREMSWVSGVFLLLLTVIMGFTGQLLRWDQNAVWSSVVGAEQAARSPVMAQPLIHTILSGGNISSATLGHFFAIHVFILPIIVVAILGFHLHLVLHNGISEPAEAGQPVDPKTYKTWYANMLDRIGVPFWPDAAWRDAVFAVFVIAAITVLAWYYGPPILDNPPDPSIVVANPKPDWYMLPYFAVLAYLPHAAEDYVIILAPVLIGLGLLSVPFISNKGERNWRKRPWAPTIVIFAATCSGVLWHKGEHIPWSPKFDAKPVPAAVVGVDSGPVSDGAKVFNTKGCLYCHNISGFGGLRGPNLTTVGDRLTHDQLVIRILKGGYNMPAYSNNLTTKQLDDVVLFLESRKESNGKPIKAEL